MITQAQSPTQPELVYPESDGHGWLGTAERLDVIEQMSGWVSPRLGIRFELSETELQLYRPHGERFATYVELAALREQERQAKEQAQKQLEQEKVRTQHLENTLRELGVNPDDL